ncbi:MAG TPA: O-antigen ligase family protein [Roseiarcus sp.]|nr:O-antigen ligase family protein [Roseiarcus sp.]
MTVADSAGTHGASASLSVSKLQRALLWLFVASGALASIEPSPYELMFIPALLAFGWRDLLFDRAMAPLIVGLALFNVGGALSLLPYIDQRESYMFSAISLYISVTAIFFAALVAKAPLDRLAVIRSGYVVAGMIAGLAGILGYFNVAGLAEHFTLYNRASGTFKDPNVLGPFLAPPLIWLSQAILLRQAKGFVRTYLPLLVMLTALLLSFSRGAWGVWVASTLMMIGLTYLTTPSSRLRRRIVIITVLGAAGIVVLLAIALSIPAIHSVFEIRFSLKQDYDVGQTGRFGDQWRSIPMLLDRPLGFGPLQYRNHFEGVDPHNVYVNAFASYGWIGGLCYAALIAATVALGWRLVFQRTPYQTEAIAIWSCLFVQILQGFQIDTDHWRHLFLLLGALYGLLAATRLYNRRKLVEDAVIPAQARIQEAVALEG